MIQYNILITIIELDEILNRPYSNEQDVQRIITQYIRFLIRYSSNIEQ